MKKNLINKLIFVTIFIAFYILSQGLLFIFLPINFNLYYFVDIFIIIFLLSIGFLFKNNWVMFSFSILNYLFVILFDLFNINLYDIFSDLLTLNKLILLTEAVSAFDTNFLHIPAIITYVIIFLIFLGINIFLAIKLKKVKEIKFRYRFLTFISTFIITFSISIGCLEGLDRFVTINNKVYDSTYYNSLFKYETLKNKSFYSFYYNEFKAIAPQVELSKAQKEEYKNYFLSNLNIDNKLSGELDNYNVVTILLETGTPYTIDKELTPNLYKLSGKDSNGIEFKNSYSENKTNFSESIALIGSVPTYGSMSLLNDVSSVNTFFSLANMLKNNGYNTTYAHDNGENFYRRKYYIPTIGYENIYFHNDLYNKDETSFNQFSNGYKFNGSYSLDTTTMERIILKDKEDDIFSVNKPFYFHFSSLVTHGPYSENYNNVNNYDNFKKLGYFDRIKASSWVNPLKGYNIENGYSSNLDKQYEYYEAAMMNFDDALGKLIKYLKEKGIYDNTLFVIFGDHNNYYENICMHLVNDIKKDPKNIKMYETTMCIYNEKLNNKYFNTYKNHIFNDFVSPYIITPTILDLLNIDYFPLMYASDSIFSSSYAPINYSHKIYSIFNDIYYSSDGINVEIFDPLKHTLKKEKEFKEDMSNLIDRYYYINKIYNLNLFKDYKF